MTESQSTQRWTNSEYPHLQMKGDVPMNRENMCKIDQDPSVSTCQFLRIFFIYKGIFHINLWNNPQFALSLKLEPVISQTQPANLQLAVRPPNS